MDCDVKQGDLLTGICACGHMVAVHSPGMGCGLCVVGSVTADEAWMGFAESLYVPLRAMCEGQRAALLETGWTFPVAEAIAAEMFVAGIRFMSAQQLANVK